MDMIIIALAVHGNLILTLTTASSIINCEKQTQPKPRLYFKGIIRRPLFSTGSAIPLPQAI